MASVIGVRFECAGKMYYFDPEDRDVHRGMSVIVETSRGKEMGTVVMDRTEVPEDQVTRPLRPILRIADSEDFDVIRKNREKEKEAYRICREKIAEHHLEMKLVRVEYTFDNNKILFYFTADGRVDFRELVKDLASVFKTRIELRQIGVRDETKMLGGIGICGRDLCCHSYMSDFIPVSIKMAKEQNLSLNPTKISGVCGRLMCCLKNEESTYEYLHDIMPAEGARAMVTATGEKGQIQSVNVLRQTVRLLVDNGDEVEVREYPVDELKFRPKHAGNDEDWSFLDPDPADGGAAGHGNHPVVRGSRNGRGDGRNHRSEQGMSAGRSTRDHQGMSGETDDRKMQAERGNREDGEAQESRRDREGSEVRRERDKRADRPSRPERESRGPRGERDNRAAREARGFRGERGARPERGERAGRDARGERENRGDRENRGRTEAGERRRERRAEDAGLNRRNRGRGRTGENRPAGEGRGSGRSRESRGERRPANESRRGGENLPEVKAEVKAETRPEAKPEVRAASRVEARPEIRAENRAETKPEVRGENRPESQSSAGPENGNA